MKYQGSKARIGKQIAAVIKAIPHQHFYEPFCGGLNLTQYLGGVKYCSDINKYLIAMWEAILHEDWEGLNYWDEEFYVDVKDNKWDRDPKIVGWVGFCTYGGGFFNGYPRESTGERDLFDEYKRNILSQKRMLHNVILSCKKYSEIEAQPNSLVYCDPPYYGTKQYDFRFDHYSFWEWCRQISKDHAVLVSEYTAPKDFKTVWSSPRTSTLSLIGGTSHIEKVFIHESRFQGYFNRGKFV